MTYRNERRRTGVVAKVSQRHGRSQYRLRSDNYSDVTKTRVHLLVHLAHEFISGFALSTTTLSTLLSCARRLVGR